MGDLLFTDVVCLLSYFLLYTADKGYPSIILVRTGQKGDFPASFPLASRSFPRRAPVSRESGQFSFSKLFFSTNHCTARGIVSILDPWISTKSAAVSLFMLRFAWNSELKLLSPSPFEPRGRFWVLFVRLFVILDTASSKHWALPAGTPGIDRTLSYSASGERSKLLCLWTDLHEIWNLGFFRRVTLNRAVISKFRLFVCLLSWTQLNCSSNFFFFFLSLSLSLSRQTNDNFGNFFFKFWKREGWFAKKNRIGHKWTGLLVQ